MPGKPALPDAPTADLPLIAIDTGDGSDFTQILRAATFAADCWTAGPRGPYANPGMVPVDVARGQIREALLHLLELGLVDIDGGRLAAMFETCGIPTGRRGA